MKEYLSPTIATYTFPNLTGKNKTDLENFKLNSVKHLACSLEKRILNLQNIGLKVKISDLNGNSLEMDSLKKNKISFKILGPAGSGSVIRNQEEADDLADYITHLSCQQDLD